MFNSVGNAIKLRKNVVFLGRYPNNIKIYGRD